MSFTTSQIANIVGVHPNTVRLYEKSGFISEVPRKTNGYRIYSEKHFDEMIFARIALPGPYPVKSKPIFDMINFYINQHYIDALECATLYFNTVIHEKEQSTEAMRILDNWHKRKCTNNTIIAFNRREMAKKCDITVDTLRTWERNNIYKVRKHKNNRIEYTIYDYEKIVVIRLLRKAGFSISSIYELFNHNQNILPSEFFNKIYNSRETICATDNWITHLNQHIDRAKSLIKAIKEKI